MTAIDRLRAAPAENRARTRLLRAKRLGVVAEPVDPSSVTLGAATFAASRPFLSSTAPRIRLRPKLIMSFRYVEVASTAMRMSAALAVAAMRSKVTSLLRTYPRTSTSEF
jgi:hypothetical protein